MRTVALVVLMAGAAMAGCVTKPRPVAAGGPACPALPTSVVMPVIHAAREKAFDVELQRRFGTTGSHILLDYAVDAQGDSVVTGRRIGPAKFAMPETGKGGEVQAVFQACTHKVLKTGKLAELESEPQPIAPDDEPAT